MRWKGPPAEKLKKLLRDNDIMQEEIARRVHRSQSTVSLWLSGARTPNVDLAATMVSWCDEGSLDYLFGLAPSPSARLERENAALRGLLAQIQAASAEAWAKAPQLLQDLEREHPPERPKKQIG